MAQGAAAAAASPPAASPALESASNYALEDDVALPPASSASPHRRRRVLLIVAALVVVVGAAVAIGVAASSKSKSSKSSSSDPSDSVSTGDAFVCDSVQQDFGYITLPNKRDGHYFYWFFESRSNPSEDPLVLWLTGGPGCSSLWAMLAENGPCHVQRDDLSTTKNPYSWNANANVVWLDQPTFTGYSYGAEPGDMDESAADVRVNLYLFLQGFLDKHPALRTRALFITGESYAGHYIPPSAQYIWQQNAAAAPARRINLQGIAIGNGITAATIQYAHYLDMADNAYGIPLASNAERLAGARANTSACVDRIRACQADPGPFECIDALNVCYEDMQSALDFTDRNPYDIRQECAEPNAVDCYNSTHITQFLNSPKIQSYLKIPTSKVPAWLECNDNVSSSFINSGDYLADHEDAVAALLNGSDVRVLIYAGDADTVCNWRGNEAWTKQLAWTHQREFNAAPERAFVTANGSKAGVARSFGTQFTFLRVFESGHMVPMDQPAAALEMLLRFMANATL